MTVVDFDPRELEAELILAIARAAVAERLGAASRQPPARSWLAVHAATFVTIRDGEQLHGCIGTVEPRGKRGDDLRHNRMKAA